MALRINHVTRLLPTHTLMPSPGLARRRHLLQSHPPPSLTNPIASTLRAHFTRQGDTLLASLRDKDTHITDVHTYK
jgi:hypothetical protein